MKKILFCFSTFLILFLVSCQNDDDMKSKNQETENPSTDPTKIDLSKNFGNEVEYDFIGKVTDIDKNPISNVTIEIGDSYTSTDQNGIFIIKNAPAYEHFAYVKASKIGFINGSRALIPTDGTNKISIVLLPEIITKTVESGNPSTVNLPSGVSINLPGKYIDKNKNSYSGNVDVIMHYLSPENENIDEEMPGMLYAANSQNEERLLQTYGMLLVELRGSNGENLNLGEGSSAEIKMPVPSNMLNSAPNSIPLWYFNEEKGYWIEEGEANLQGNEYVGEVSHFSFWNCDIQIETVEYCISIQDENNAPLSNMKVTIESSNFGETHGITNDNGEICGLIPANETLTLKVFSNENCSTEAYNSQIGPFGMDNQESLTINSNNFQIENVSAQIYDCNNTALSNGYVILNYYNETLLTNIVNGNYNMSFLTCNNTNSITVEAVNSDNLESSGILNYPLTSPQTNLGPITACGNEISEYIQYSIDNGLTESALILEDIEAFFNPNSQPHAELKIRTPFNDICFYLVGNLTSPYIGEYNIAENSSEIGFIFIEICPIPNEADVTFNITNIGEVGEYIDMDFNGTFEDFDGTTHTINGNLHVLRDQ